MYILICWEDMERDSWMENLMLPTSQKHVKFHHDRSLNSSKEQQNNNLTSTWIIWEDSSDFQSLLQKYEDY